jgi:carbamoyl-phosphate synthase large subunit
MLKNEKILVECSGSSVSAYMIKAIQADGFEAVASDITNDVHGRFIADHFVLVPKYNDPELWNKIEGILFENNISIVFPSFDESLYGWAENKLKFQEKGVAVIISDPKVIAEFQDKYKTYHFFKNIGLDTPKTSLENNLRLLKPRFGRGGKGIILDPPPNTAMNGMITQDYIEGVEYTVDVLCDISGEPIYIVPRKRLGVVDGKSTGGVVVEHEAIKEAVIKVCASTHFIGPINIQCIETKNNELYFIEANPRVAGGMALSFAATQSWVAPIVNNIVNQINIKPLDIDYGLKMFRYYNEVFSK